MLDLGSAEKLMEWPSSLIGAPKKLKCWLFGALRSVLADLKSDW
jgi:hypothetical protein